MSNQGYGYNGYDNGYSSSGYGQQNPYSTPGSNPYGDVEMGAMPAGQGYGVPPAHDQNAILNQCRDVENSVQTVENYISQINGLYRRILSDADPARENALRNEADNLAEQTKGVYRNLIERMKSIKRMPDAGSPRNAPQIGKVERRLKAAITQYQRVQTDFRKGLESQMARQYRIVRPDATDAEVQEAVQDTNQQIFSQALIQSDRRGDAQKVSQMVRARHEEIQKIERDFVELAQMFEDLDTLVVQQEEPVQRIDQAGEDVTTNVVKANEEINGAIDKARARNRKKWWCLLISILIIIIIVVVVVVVVLVTRK